LLSNYPEGRVS